MKTTHLITYSILITLLLSVIACKKDNDKDNKKDCEVNNYGTLKVNFANPANQYRLLVNGRYKIEATGIANDTLHSVPGSFNLQILNTTNSSVTTTPITITTCTETVVNSTN